MKDVRRIIRSQVWCSLRLLEAGMPCSCHMGCLVPSSIVRGMKVRRNVDRVISARSVVVVLMLHVARWLFVVTRKSRLFSSVVVIVRRALIMRGGSGVMKGPKKLMMIHDLACGSGMTALKASRQSFIWKAKVCCHSSSRRRASGGFRRR
jgi:hypothetical protein